MTLRTDLSDDLEQAGLHVGQHNEVNAAVLALQASVATLTTGESGEGGGGISWLAPNSSSAQAHITTPIAVPGDGSAFPASWDSGTNSADVHVRSGDDQTFNFVNMGLYCVTVNLTWDRNTTGMRRMAMNSIPTWTNFGYVLADDLHTFDSFLHQGTILAVPGGGPGTNSFLSLFQTSGISLNVTGDIYILRLA